MPKIKITLAISILIPIILACNTIAPTSVQTAEPPTTTPPPAATVIIEPTSPPQKIILPASADDVPRVDVAVAKAAFDSGQAIIVDVRSPQAFKVEHIDGAVYVSVTDIQNNSPNLTLDKNQWIITYCT